MDTEFHYYLTALIAQRAGFSEHEASTIAYASEYVDENDGSFQILNRDGKPDYSNFISQTINILKPKSELMRIFPIFHFVPGDPSAESTQRRDGKMHWLNTTPNNEYANAMLDAAFNAPSELRLYQIGIASHAYVDTWAHQNFVGWFDDFNNIGLDPKPDIGHANAEHHPDWMSHHWEDQRLMDANVNNRDRFIAAAQALFTQYCQYQNTRHQRDYAANWPALEDELLTLMGPSYGGNNKCYAEQRISGYRLKMPWLADFDEKRWFQAAIHTKVKGLPDPYPNHPLVMLRDEHRWLDDYHKEQTDWYRFQEAVKAHENFALKLMSERFSRMGVVLSAV